MDLHCTLGIWVKTFKQDALLQTWKPSSTPHTHIKSQMGELVVLPALGNGDRIPGAPGPGRLTILNRCTPGQWDPFSKEVNGLSSGLCVFFKKRTWQKADMEKEHQQWLVRKLKFVKHLLLPRSPIWGYRCGEKKKKKTIRTSLVLCKRNTAIWLINQMQNKSESS